VRIFSLVFVVLFVSYGGSAFAAPTAPGLSTPSYTCSTHNPDSLSYDDPSVPYCTCDGLQDCMDMGNDHVCKGKAACDSDGCWCLWKKSTRADTGQTPESSGSGTKLSPSQDSVLSAPSRLSISNLTNTSLKISWRDNSNNEDGFIIDSMTPVNANNGSVLKMWSTLITVRDRRESRVMGMGVRSRTISSLTAGKRYCYRVRAFKGKIKSSFSETVCKNTLSRR